MTNIEHLEFVENKFKAIANQQRIKIINFIKDQERSVNEIMEHLHYITQPTVTEHLRKLYFYQVAGKKMHDNKVYYHLKDKTILDALRLYDGIF